MKYTIKDFCKKYNNEKNEQVKETFIKSIMSVDYVPYERKITICEKIIESTHYTNNASGLKKLHINSPAKYMLYCLNLVNEYTDIDVDFKNALEDFNLLNKCELLNVIYNSISEKEIKEFSMILDMVENDVIQNEYETHAFIINQVERFGELIGVSLKPVIEQLNKTIENMDEKTIDKVFDKLNGLKSNSIKGKFNLMK